MWFQNKQDHLGLRGDHHVGVLPSEVSLAFNQRGVNKSGAGPVEPQGRAGGLGDGGLSCTVPWKAVRGERREPSGLMGQGLEEQKMVSGPALSSSSSLEPVPSGAQVLEGTTRHAGPIL